MSVLLFFNHRLSAHICGYKCFQIELSRGYDYAAFHDDIKKLYDMAGVKNEHTVFLFTDTQVRKPFSVSRIIVFKIALVNIFIYIFIYAVTFFSKNCTLKQQLSHQKRVCSCIIRGYKMS